MNTITAVPAVSRACRIRRSGLSSEAETTTLADRFRQDHPPRMLPSAEWTEFLTLDEMCDRYIRWMLDRCGGNRVAAAQFLGIGRTSLYRWLNKADREKRCSSTGNRLQEESVPQTAGPIRIPYIAQRIVQIQLGPPTEFTNDPEKIEEREEEEHSK